MKQLRGQLEEERTRRDRHDRGGNYDECRSRTRGWSEEEMLEERISFRRSNITDLVLHWTPEERSLLR